jgi:hypothetical protein
MMVERGGLRGMCPVREPMRGIKDKSKRPRFDTTGFIDASAGQRVVHERRVIIPSHNTYKEQIQSC